MTEEVFLTGLKFPPYDKVVKCCHNCRYCIRVECIRFDDETGLMRKPRVYKLCAFFEDVLKTNIVKFYNAQLEKNKEFVITYDNSETILKGLQHLGVLPDKQRKALKLPPAHSPYYDRDYFVCPHHKPSSLYNWMQHDLVEIEYKRKRVVNNPELDLELT